MVYALIAYVVVYGVVMAVLTVVMQSLRYFLIYAILLCIQAVTLFITIEAVKLRLNCLLTTYFFILVCLAFLGTTVTRFSIVDNYYSLSSCGKSGCTANRMDDLSHVPYNAAGVYGTVPMCPLTDCRVAQVKYISDTLPLQYVTPVGYYVGPDGNANLLTPCPVVANGNCDPTCDCIASTRPQDWPNGGMGLSSPTLQIYLGQHPCPGSSIQQPLQVCSRCSMFFVQRGMIRETDIAWNTACNNTVGQLLTDTDCFGCIGYSEPIMTTMAVRICFGLWVFTIVCCGLIFIGALLLKNKTVREKTKEVYTYIEKKACEKKKKRNRKKNDV